MNLKKVKKLLLKQGYDETKIDELLKELEKEPDDDEIEVEEQAETKTPNKVVDEKEEVVEKPVKEVEVETQKDVESEQEVKDVAQEVVDETLEEKLPHDEKAEEKEMQRRDEHLTALDEQVKSLIDTQGTLLARITELEKQLESIAVVGAVKDVGEPNSTSLTKPNTTDVLSEVLRKLNNRK